MPTAWQHLPYPSSRNCGPATGMGNGRCLHLTATSSPPAKAGKERNGSERRGEEFFCSTFKPNLHNSSSFEGATGIKI